MEILISSGYGAGWSTRAHSPEKAIFMLYYRPIIDYLKAGGQFKNLDVKVKYDRKGDVLFSNGVPDCLKQFVREFKEKFGEVPFIDGAENLEVQTVDPYYFSPSQISEYDGYESID